MTTHDTLEIDMTTSSDNIWIFLRIWRNEWFLEDPIIEVTYTYNVLYTIHNKYKIHTEYFFNNTGEKFSGDSYVQSSII